MDGFCLCQRILPPWWQYQVPQTGSCSWHPLSWCTDTIFKMTTFVFEIYENLQRNPLSLCLYFVVTWRVLNLKRFSENCFGIISQWTGFMWSGNLVLLSPDSILTHQSQVPRSLSMSTALVICLSSSRKTLRSPWQCQYLVQVRVLSLDQDPVTRISTQ